MNRRVLDKVERKKELVKTVVNIILETGEEPTVGKIIANSKISRRTLFNYYGKKGELFKDIEVEIMSRIESMFISSFNPKVKNFEDLILEIVNKRVEVYEYLSPLRKILERKKHENVDIERNFKINLQKDIARLRNRLHEYLVTQENPEKALNMIYVAVSSNTWNFLTSELNLSIDEAKRIMVEMALKVIRV